MEDTGLKWHKSTYSSNGGGECIEVASWRKSTYSSNGGGNCVEVGDRASRVLVRDTKDRAGPVLRFSAAAWRRFADQVNRSLEDHNTILSPYAGQDRPAAGGVRVSASG
jgi:hypothetical protein